MKKMKKKHCGGFIEHWFSEIQRILIVGYKYVQVCDYSMKILYKCFSYYLAIYICKMMLSVFLL